MQVLKLCWLWEEFPLACGLSSRVCFCLAVTHVLFSVITLVSTSLAKMCAFRHDSHKLGEVLRWNCCDTKYAAVGRLVETHVSCALSMSTTYTVSFQAS